MALPNAFTSVTAATGAELDANFDAVAKLGIVPGVITGTNTLTHTPTTGITPDISAYANFLRVAGIVAVSNTTAVTLKVGALAAKNVYIDGASGPAVLAGGELIADNMATFAYDSALNSGAAGWHLVSMIPVTEMLDLIGNTRGDMLYRASASWASLGIGTGSQVIIGGTDPAWASITAVLDTFAGATSVGTILTRSGSGWAVVQPGASGTVLTSQGVGSIPVWAV